jgi:hypothetical protein
MHWIVGSNRRAICSARVNHGPALERLREMPATRAIPHPLLAEIAVVVRKVFYTFLDIMGILLGVFLILVGWWISTGRDVSGGLGMAILIVGIAAAIIHTGHYFNLRITRWIFGSGTFFHEDESRA